MSLPQALEEALFDSLSTGTFVDVKFYAFSQRTSSGRIRCPRPLYANSHILETVPYFRSLLSDTFSEGKLQDLRSSFPPGHPTELDDHDFLDDSDLEDVEDDAKPTIKTPGAASDKRKSPLKSPGHDFGFLSSSQPRIPRPESMGGTSPIRVTRSVDPGTKLGKVVVLRGISFVTLRAVLFFLYTGEISFAPPGSAARDMYKPANDNTSAKSVYLAADKYDIPELKALALHWIRATIHSRDIMKELASDFTATFPEIREICLQQLANALYAGDRVNTAKNLMSAIRSSIHGDRDCGIDPETRGAIFDMLAEGYSQTPRVFYVPPVRRVIRSSPGQRANPGFRRPIVPRTGRTSEKLCGSLVAGKFLDGQIKAYRGKCKDKKLTRPSSIYFSTASLPPSTRDKIRYGSVTRLPSERGYDSDSDLEDDEDGELEPRNVGGFGKVQPNGETGVPTFAGGNVRRMAIMECGSWKTWRAALFFVYSRKVAFSPLRSQSIPRPPSSEAQPMAPCSPKSAFVLAERIAFQRLQDCAREDLLRKITAKNVMIEYFSKFVNSHAPLLYTVNDIVQKTRTAEIDVMVRKKLVESTGDDPHVSVALELFLQDMIENNRRIMSNCINCRRKYTALERHRNGKCQSCAGRLGGGQSW